MFVFCLDAAIPRVTVVCLPRRELVGEGMKASFGITRGNRRISQGDWCEGRCDAVVVMEEVVVKVMVVVVKKIAE